MESFWWFSRFLAQLVSKNGYTSEEEPYFDFELVFGSYCYELRPSPENGFVPLKKDHCRQFIVGLFTNCC